MANCHPHEINASVLELIPEDLDGWKLLDVGCGSGLMGYLLRISKNGDPHLVGLDLWRPYLLKLKKLNIYCELILADASHLPFREKSFEIVLAIEVLEHQEKTRAYRLLDEIEKGSSHGIIVTTPLGRWEQEAVDGNPYMMHKSFWEPKELKSRGYDTQIVEIQPVY